MVAAYGIYFGTHKLGFIHSGVCLPRDHGHLVRLDHLQALHRPIREHEAAVLICTIAMAMAMQEIMLLMFTGVT